MLESMLQKYNAKSIKNDFRSLSEDEQAKVLVEDSLMLSSDFFDPSVLSEEDSKNFYSIEAELNDHKNIKDNITKSIVILKKYPEIKDYQILTNLISMCDSLGMDYETFTKEFILRPYYGTNNTKLLEAPKEKKQDSNKHDKAKVDPAEKEHPEDDTPTEEIKLIGAPKEKKQDSDKQKAVTKGAAKDMNAGTITANDIVNSCNAHSQQQKAQAVEHDHGCTCGHCGNQKQQNNQQVPPVHPELSLDKKTELLKSHIDFSAIKNFTVKEWEVDNLLQFAESTILKQKLKEMGSACNPDFPKLTMSKKYRFDKNLYKFAFYAETNDPNKVIVVLYNTHMTLNPQFGLCNEMAFTLAPVNHVK